MSFDVEMQYFCTKMALLESSDELYYIQCGVGSIDLP